MSADNTDVRTGVLTSKDRERLEENGQAQIQANERGEELDLLPVAKVFTPDGQCTWLLTEIYPHNQNLAFGLCDLGEGCPELGDVHLVELERCHGRLGLPVERDNHFKPNWTLARYAEIAYSEGRICT